MNGSETTETRADEEKLLGYDSDQNKCLHLVPVTSERIIMLKTLGPTHVTPVLTECCLFLSDYKLYL